MRLLVIFLFLATSFNHTIAYPANIIKVSFDSQVREKRDISQKSVQSIFDADAPFTGAITIGNPPQKVNVLFDTGSPHLAVFGPDNDSCGATCENGVYNVSKSSTGVETNKSLGWRYADEENYYGQVVNDVVAFGELQVNMPFLVAEKVDGNNNGLAGIGHNDGEKSIVDFLAEQKQISRRVFSTYDFNDEGYTGAIVFGGLDRAKYSGELTVVPLVDTSQLFNVRLSAISSPCGTIISNDESIMIDTGADANRVTSDIYHAIFQSFNSKITTSLTEILVPSKNNDNYVFKCKKAQPLTFNFSGKEFVIVPEGYLLHLLNNDGSAFVDEEGDALCSAMFFEADSNTIGSYSLKGHYVLWDIDNKQIAFAKAVATNDEDLVEIFGDVPNTVTATGYSGESVKFTYTKPEATSIPSTVSFRMGPLAGAPEPCFASITSSSAVETLSDFTNGQITTVTNDAIVTVTHVSQEKETSAICLQCSTTLTVSRTITSGVCLQCSTSTYPSPTAPKIEIATSDVPSSTMTSMTLTRSRTIISGVCLTCSTSSPRRKDITESENTISRTCVDCSVLTDSNGTVSEPESTASDFCSECSSSVYSATTVTQSQITTSSVCLECLSSTDSTEIRTESEITTPGDCLGCSSFDSNTSTVVEPETPTSTSPGTILSEMERTSSYVCLECISSIVTESPTIASDVCSECTTSSHPTGIVTESKVITCDGFPNCSVSLESFSNASLSTSFVPSEETSSRSSIGPSTVESIDASKSSVAVYVPETPNDASISMVPSSIVWLSIVLFSVASSSVL